MEESFKELVKELGFENAEKIIHLYLYARYLPHYLYYLGSPIGLAERKPPGEIPKEIEEMLEVLTGKVARDVISPETSTYHGKVVPLSLACDLVSVKEDVELRGLERVIPYKIARDIVLKNPESIAVLNCGCRMLREKPCEPIDVCLAVGDPFASFAVERGYLNARRISQDEACEILKAENRRGHVHAAYFKDAAGDRFYAICNCCSCCCLGMLAWNRFGVPILASSGFVAKVEEGECNACGDCESICPFSAIEVGDIAVVKEDKCMGCGVCEEVCPAGVISLKRDPSKPEPLDINQLIKNSGKEGN